MQHVEIERNEGPVTGPQAGFEAYTPFVEVERVLEHWLRERAPAIPESKRETTLRWMPRIALLSIPMWLFNIVLGVGMSVLTASLMGLVQVAFTVVSAGLYVKAISGLSQRSRSGWLCFTYACGLGVLQSILSLELIGVAVGMAPLWLAFQIKYDYR
jgi:hypothetical protein